MKKIALYLLLSLTVVSCKKEKIEVKEEVIVPTPTPEPVAHPAEHTGTGKWDVTKISIVYTEGSTTDSGEVENFGHVQFKADGTFIIHNQAENSETVSTYSINESRTQITATINGVTYSGALIWTTPNQMTFNLDFSSSEGSITQQFECTRQ